MAITDCKKCGEKIRIVPETVGNDSQGLPIIHRIAYCDNCRIKYDLDYTQIEKTSNASKKEEKKYSTLSVWALVLSLFGITSFIAFILALVDLCQNDKSKKHAGSWFALIFTGLYAFVLFFNQSDVGNTTNLTNDLNPAPIHNSVSVDDGIIEISTNGCSLKYLRHEFVENALGDKCLAVYYEFTNNSNESKAFYTTFSDKAFQNGIELSNSFFTVDDSEYNNTKDIKPGITVEVYTLFKTSDNSVVELEVSPWVSFNEKPLDTMKLSLE